VNTVMDEWQQLLWVDPKKPPVIENIGKADQTKSLREWIDGLARSREIYHSGRNTPSKESNDLREYAAGRREALDKVALAKAKFYEDPE
jgi:hypothetical protein